MVARIFSSVLAFAVVVTLAAEPVSAQQGAGPRDGKYLILSYGATNRPPLVLGHFTLEGGSYKVFLVGGRQVGEGRYRYDAGSNAVQWIDGPYQGQFGGEFSTDNGGRTHKVRLKRTTIGTNSGQ